MSHVKVNFGNDASTTKYVPPHLRNRQASPQDTQSQAPSGWDDGSSASFRGFPDRSERKFNDGWGSTGEGFQNDGSNRQGHNRQLTRPSATGTGWDIRDGRSYHPEAESEVFETQHERCQTGINFDSYESIPVDMSGRGSDTIERIDSFQSAKGLHPLILQNVIRVNYDRPTPVQKHAIPTILAGRDLMACAQTGSGKTAAFLFPVITELLRHGPPRPLAKQQFQFRKPACPVSLVLAPTRELAVQIFEEARKFAFATGVRTVVLYGGCEIRAQLFDLEKGCDICVATPGRLTDLCERGKVRLNMIKYLTLDEADRMLDMGFAPQIRAIVLSGEMPTASAGRQTVMFSATFPPEIQRLASEFLTDYISLTVGRVGSAVDFIKQQVLYADEDQKAKYLLKTIQDTRTHSTSESIDLTLVFVETKRRADMIELFLQQRNIPAVSIHGDKSQRDREEALKLFRNGKRPVLVATDLAARGLDIQNIKHVINCDLPGNVDDYVHRIGRTGRAGNFGLATSFVNETNRPILRDLLGLLEESRQEVPKWFQSLVQTCTAAFSRGGFARGGSARGGRGGRGGSTFGSRDIRQLGESDKKTFNAGAQGDFGSGQWRPGTGTGAAAATGFTRPANATRDRFDERGAEGGDDGW